MKLYELKDAYTQLMDIEDIAPEDFAMALEAISGDIDEKLMNIGRWVRNLETESAGIKTEEERLAKKRKALDNKVSSLKEYVRATMIAVDKRKASDGVITWAIQNNPPKVEIDPNADIPLCWYTEKVIRDLDKNAIKQAIVGGGTVPGCRLIQETGVRLK